MNADDRRVTTIRLINTGGSVEFVFASSSCAPIGPEARAERVQKKKGKNRGLYVRESTVYSAYSENERKRRKRWNESAAGETGGGMAARGRRECNSKRE